MNAFVVNNSNPSISLHVSSSGRSGGRAGNESRAYNYVFQVEFKFRLQFHCGSLSTELSDFRLSSWSGNERECKQTDAVNY